MPIRDIVAQNRSLDNDYGTTRGPNAPDDFEVALFDINPASGGVEITGPGYARAALDSDDWLPADEGVKRVTVAFPDSTDTWSQATYWGLYDPVVGLWWDCAPLVLPLNVTGAGTGPTVALSVFYDTI